MKKNFITSWKRLVSLLKMEKDDILQVLYYAIFAGILSLSLPLGIQAIVNLIQGAQISTSWIVLVILVSLAVVFVGILELLQLRIIENIQQKLFVRASFEFSNRFPKIKMSEFNNEYPPELANRFFDILTVQKGVSKLLVDFPAALLQILFGLILLSLYHPFFIIYGLLLLVLIYVLFQYSAQKGLQTSLEESKHKYKVAHWIQEIARSVVSFKLSGKTRLALDKNDQLVLKYVSAREDHFKILAFQFSKMIVFKLLVTAGLLVVGGLLVLNQQMNIGQFVAAEIIILLIISSVEKLILGLESFYDVLTSLEKLGQVLDKDLENQKGYVDLSQSSEIDIELKNISYQEGNDLILNNISLHIPAKQRILIQGSNGSGKSTFLRLLAGIIEPTQGDFFINNSHQNTIMLNHYRSLLGLSLTEETPFEGTILENLTLGDTSIDAKFINEVIDLVGLTDFVKTQEKGLQSILSPEGKKISYTLSKKIILARAILKRPKFFILKEPLDQLDAKEAKAIVDYLTQPNRNWGLIVVSKEPYWETKVDKKIEMRNGTLIS